jgi:uncharacterized DUF497 family protein
MRIRDLFWDEETEGHIARHNVSPEDVEEVCFGRNWAIRSGRRRKAVFGQTSGGRYLLVIIEDRGHDEFDVVTARDMTPTERKRYRLRQGKR